MNTILDFWPRNSLLIYVVNTQLNQEIIFYMTVESIWNIGIPIGSLWRISLLFLKSILKHFHSMKILLSSEFIVINIT